MTRITKTVTRMTKTLTETVMRVKPLVQARASMWTRKSPESVKKGKLDAKVSLDR